MKDGKLSRDQLFDSNYQKIDGSNPQRFHTEFDAFTDQSFLKIEDSYLKDADVVFAAVVDRNGYLPTHNTRYTTSSLSDAANRTKRIFNDAVGLAAAQNETPLLKQVYVRDTGETMWDVSAPIIVNGEHWGAFRVGFSIQGVNADGGGDHPADRHGPRVGHRSGVRAVDPHRYPHRSQHFRSGEAPVGPRGKLPVRSRGGHGRAGGR